jgi:hypothetical protein
VTSVEERTRKASIGEKKGVDSRAGLVMKRNEQDPRIKAEKRRERYRKNKGNKTKEKMT